METNDEQGITLAAAFARAVQVDAPRVAEVAASLHRSVRDENGLADLLGRAAAAAVRWLPDVDFAGITVQLGRDPVTAAATDPVVLTVDELQLELDEGPSLTAMRTGQIVSVDAASAAIRWPELTARSREHGVASFLASPLLLEGSGRGCINLYSRVGSGFDGTEADLLAVLASYVSRGLADFAVLRSAQVQVEQMQQAMAGRAPIEQAKGILMAVHRITADAAFNLLRTQSQNSNTKLHDVADAFVATQVARPLSPHDAAPDDAAPNAGPDATESAAGPERLPDFRSAFDHAPIGMAIADEEGTLLTVNEALARLLGGTPRELEGTRLFEVVHPEDLADAHAACGQLHAGAELTTVFGVRLRGAGSTWTPATVSAAKVLAADGALVHVVMSVADVTEHELLTAQLRHQALHDPLTGLPNRTLFLEKLRRVATSHAAAGAPWSVLFIDVDGFKLVNDGHGHVIGDAVLVAVAERLRVGLGPDDAGFRFGGDEFAVVSERTDATAAAALAALLKAGLSAPVDVDGVQVEVSVSIGTATADPGDETDPVELLRAADAAMYGGKRNRLA